MNRAELIAKLNEADVDFDRRLGRDKLHELAQDHGLMSDDGATPEIPANDAEIEVECLWSNVWTTRGKMLRGQVMTIPRTEYEALFAKRAVMEAPK